MGNYVRKYDLGNIRVDLPYASHIHDLPLLHFQDFKGSVDINLIYNRRLFGNNYNFNLPDGYKINIQKKIIFNNVTNVGKPYKFIDSDGSIITLIDNGNSIYTFDDESQRIMRAVNGLYEVEYSDFSKEEYDGSGYILRSIDKYGDEVLNYVWESGKLRAVFYRNSKLVLFLYDNTDTFITNIEFYKENNTLPLDATTSLVHTSGNVSVLHYSGVLFKTYTTTDTTNTLSYVVEAADHETPDTILYSKECVYNVNGKKIKLVDKVDNKETFVEYDFSDIYSGDGSITSSYNIVEITNDKMVSQRLQYRNKKLFYSYEIENNTKDASFSGTKYNGTVDVYNTTSNLSACTSSFKLKQYDGLEMRRNSSNFWFLDVNSNSNTNGYYLLTGWMKATDASSSGMFVPGTVSFNISNSEVLDVVEDFFVTANVANKWLFFAHKFNYNNAQMYVHISNNNIELADLRLCFQKTVETNSKVIDIPLMENVLIAKNDIVINTNPYKIPYENINFFANDVNLNGSNKFVTINDIVRYQTRMKKYGFSNEVYYNNCRGVIFCTENLKFAYIANLDNKFNVIDYCAGTRFYKKGKEYWSYTKIGSQNIQNAQNINSTCISLQKLNNFFDVIERTEQGVTTQYTYENGLVVKETVPSIYERNTEYIVTASNQSYNVIKTTDEFGYSTNYYVDKIWGSIEKIEFPDGSWVDKTLDDDKSVISKITFGLNNTDLNNNINYSKGNVSSLYSDALKYDFAYENGKLVKVEKYQNDTANPKVIFQEMTHTDNYTTVNYANYYSETYNYDKYGRLTSVNGVLENIYDNDNYSTNGFISNKDSQLVRQIDKITNNTTIIEHDENDGKINEINRGNSEGHLINSETYVYDSQGRLVEDNYLFDVLNGNEYLSYINYDTSETDDIVNSIVKDYFYSKDGYVLGSTSNSYDSYKRLVSKSHDIGPKTFTKSYQYNKTRIEQEENCTGEMLTYIYDSMGRIFHITSANNNRQYNYDKYGRLIREDNQLLDKTYTYEYNEIGNIVSKKTYNYTTGNTLPTNYSTTNYTYDTINPDRLISCGSKTLTYNSIGYPTSYNGYNLTWNKGKLVTMLKGNRRDGSESYTFQYNALGQRIQKTYSRMLGTNGINNIAPNDIINSVTTYEYDNQGRLLFETTNITYYSDGYDQKKVEYIYDQNSIIGMRYTHGTSSELYYFNRNIFGDVTEMYNTLGAVVAQYAYDAYGNCTIKQCASNTLANANPIRYRGYYYDVETNLFLVSSRYYSPELCRWISPDDIEYLDPESVNGLNLYCYCMNNPIMYVDPTGHFAIWVFLGVVAISAIAGAIDGGVTAAMSGQNFWKGFAAGAIGGAVGGVINYFLPGAGNLLGRAASTMIYDITNEIFQTGTFDINNLGLYIADTFMDVTLSLLYLDKVGSIANLFVSTAVGGAIDAGVDIIQTPLYFTSEAQQRIRGTNNKNNRTNSIFANRLTYAY